jgi:hypothetical protein
MPYGIQQPSVSAQVNGLERDLGVALYCESTAESKIRRAFLEEVKKRAARVQPT